MGQERRVRRRAGRRTNIALLVLLTLAFGTGWAAFGTGTATPARVVTALHGVAGLALVLLVPWKSLIVRRSRAFRSVSWRAASGVMLGVLVAVSLLAGVMHVLGGFRTYAGLTPMQMHVGAAVLAVPFAVLHVLQHPQRPRRLDRLLPASLPPDARSVVAVSVTGYARRLPLRDVPFLLVATHVADQPLSAGHGAPARLVAPGRRGFWWVKWLDRVVVDTRPWWWQPPFPLPCGRGPRLVILEAPERKIG